MPNWRERAGTELTRIRVEEEAKRAETEAIAAQQKLALEVQEQRRIAEDQAKIETGRVKLGQFDVLRFSQPLADINKDVLRGIGKVKIGDAIVTPKKAQQIVALQFSYPNPHRVEEETVDVYEKRWGEYYVSEDRGSYSSPDGWKQSSVTKTKHGFIDTLVGKRIVGGYCGSITERSLEIAYYINLESGDTKIGVEDGYYPLIIPDDVVLNKDWEITNASIEPEEEVPFNFRPYTRGFGNETYPKYGVCVSFPYDKYDAVALNTLIDPFLLKLSMGYLSSIDGWIKDRMEVDAKIREIQSRVGQIYPYKSGKPLIF
jgi:hypothetical protein